MAIGNPALRRSIWTSAALNLRYVFKNSSVISFNYSPLFMRHAMMPVLFQDGDVTYIQTQNGSNSFENSLSINTDFKICKWLTIGPSVSYNHINYHTPTQHINKGRWH